MPYEIQRKGKCWSVVNTDTGKVHSRCATEAKAKAQMRLLYGVESGWKPTGMKMSGAILPASAPLIDVGNLYSGTHFIHSS